MAMKFISENGKEYNFSTNYISYDGGYYEVYWDGCTLIDVPVDETKLFWDAKREKLYYEYEENGKVKKELFDYWLMEQKYKRKLRLDGKTVRLELKMKNGESQNFIFESINYRDDTGTIDGFMVRKDGSIVPKEQFSMYFTKNEFCQYELYGLEIYDYREEGLVIDNEWLDDNFPKNEIQKMLHFINDNFR